MKEQAALAEIAPYLGDEPEACEQFALPRLGEHDAQPNAGYVRRGRAEPAGCCQARQRPIRILREGRCPVDRHQDDLEEPEQVRLSSTIRPDDDKGLRQVAELQRVKRQQLPRLDVGQTHRLRCHPSSCARSPVRPEILRRARRA